jgi:predicted AAA+ superfamily ATPase
MFQRLIKPLKSNSFFVLGARGTGKSTWLRSQFDPSALDTFWIDLLQPEVEDRYRQEPEFLSRDIEKRGKSLRWVIIDEVQKAPRLLDQVHSWIEKSKIQFALTGSSARKLKNASANLLAGRAFINHAFPLTTQELGDSFRLADVLQWGSLPKIYSLKESAAKADYLRSYGLTYLREEIQLEQIVRKIEPFRDFLEISALNSGKIINASRIAKEAGVDYKSVQNYFEILESTWIGFRLPAYHQSIRKSQRLAPKFYFFDNGVKKALERSLETIPAPGTSYYGELFEHWVIQEAFRLNQYQKRDYRLCYLATHGGSEIDLVIDRGRRAKPLAVEIKSAERIDLERVRKLKKLANDLQPERILYLSNDPHAVSVDGVDCLPWQEGLNAIFPSVR